MSEFKVQGKLGLDGSGFFSTLGRAESAVGKIGGMLAGAFSVGAIVSFSKSVLDLAGKLNDVSEALGINVEFLQKFVNSAAKSGGGLGDMEKFMFETNKNRQAAVNDPTGKAATAFGTLGFNQSDISRLNPQQFIEKLIDAFADGGSPQKVNALREIGGRSAKNLVGGFKDGLDEVTEIINEDLIAELDEIGDKFTSIATTLKATFAPVLKTVADAIQYALDKIAVAIAFWGSVMGSGLAGGQSIDTTINDAVAAASDVEAEREKKKKSQEETRKAKRDARRAENASSPEFVKDADAKDEKKGKGPYSDSRLAVGGFLGAGGGQSLSSIAEKTLQVQTQHLNVAKQMLDKLKSGDVPLTLIIP